MIGDGDEEPLSGVIGDDRGGGALAAELRLMLKLEPNWRAIETLRSSLLGCVAAILGSRELGETASIVISELLENAVKYGAWSGPAGRLEVELVARGQSFHVRVANPVSERQPSVARLEETIAWIRRFPDGEAAYRARLAEIARSPAQSGSGLGLVRVAREGPCSLHVESTSDRVLVSAVRDSAA
jgi:hypothetical protein